MTRQAVSRWETGETTPNADILLRLSMLFGVSVNALLTLPSEWSEVHPKTMTEFQLRDRILQEFNDLNIPGAEKIKDLYKASGERMNALFVLPNGKSQHILNDEDTYYVSVSSVDHTFYYGLVADEQQLMVYRCAYNEENTMVVFWKRFIT